MLAIILALLVTPILAPRAEGPFQDLSLDQALLQAQREKKIVLIDFFTTWCGPCKKLDQTTWKDPDVGKWLAEKAVALRLDAEKETELAKRYEVEGYPTILLLKPDGAVIDRLVGYRDAKTFLSEVADALTGKDSLTRTREQLKGNEIDPRLHSAYADELARKGRHEEALAEYLWCFDNGKGSPGYGAVRLSFLLSSIQRLGRTYSPAIEALKQRRDKLEEKLLKGEGTPSELQECDALNRHLEEHKRTLALFDQMREKGDIPPLMRLGFVHHIVGDLSEAKRYQDLLWILNDPETFVGNAIRNFESAQSFAKNLDDKRRASMESAQSGLRQHTLRQCALAYEALLATGENERAAKIGDRLIEFAPAAATYACLIEAAVRAGASSTASQLAERVVTALSEREAKPIKRAAKSLPEKK